MCSHYEAVKDAQRLQRQFGVSPAAPGELAVKTDMWPGYLGAFIRSHPHAGVGDDAVPPVECLPGLFGLVPHWATDKKKFGLKTYNARSETVHEKPSYRASWKERRFGFALIESFVIVAAAAPRGVRRAGWKLRC